MDPSRYLESSLCQLNAHQTIPLIHVLEQEVFVFVWVPHSVCVTSENTFMYAFIYMFIDTRIKRLDMITPGTTFFACVSGLPSLKPSALWVDQVISFTGEAPSLSPLCKGKVQDQRNSGTSRRFCY